MLTLEVGLDSLWRDRLGQDNDALLEQPAEEDGGTLGVVLLGNLDNDGVLSEGGTVRATQWGVGAWNDVVLLQPSDELWLGVLNRELDLVCEVLGLDATCATKPTYWQRA